MAVEFNPNADLDPMIQEALGMFFDQIKIEFTGVVTNPEEKEQQS